MSEGIEISVGELFVIANNAVLPWWLLFASASVGLFLPFWFIGWARGKPDRILFGGVVICIIGIAGHAVVTGGLSLQSIITGVVLCLLFIAMAAQFSAGRFPTDEK